MGWSKIFPSSERLNIISSFTSITLNVWLNKVLDAKILKLWSARREKSWSDMAAVFQPVRNLTLEALVLFFFKDGLKRISSFFWKLTGDYFGFWWFLQENPKRSWRVTRNVYRLAVSLIQLMAVSLAWHWHGDLGANPQTDPWRGSSRQFPHVLVVMSCGFSLEAPLCNATCRALNVLQWFSFGMARFIKSTRTRCSAWFTLKTAYIMHRS